MNEKKTWNKLRFSSEQSQATMPFFFSQKTRNETEYDRQVRHRRGKRRETREKRKRRRQDRETGDGREPNVSVGVLNHARGHNIDTKHMRSGFYQNLYSVYLLARRRNIQENITIPARNIGDIRIMRQRIHNSLACFNFAESNKSLACLFQRLGNDCSSLSLSFSPNNDSLPLLLGL